MKLPLIPIDKANHFVYGFFIFIFFSFFVIPIISLGIVILAGAGKEVYDYKKYGKFDLLDICATVLPALIMFLI